MDREVRIRYWKIRAGMKMRIEEFSKRSCVSVGTLRKFEHEEAITRLSYEKIKLAIERIENE